MIRFFSKTKPYKTSKVRKNRKGVHEHPLPHAAARWRVCSSAYSLSPAAPQVCRRLCTVPSPSPRQHFLSFSSETWRAVLFPAFLSTFCSFCSLLGFSFPFLLLFYPSLLWISCTFSGKVQSPPFPECSLTQRGTKRQTSVLSCHIIFKGHRRK